MSLNPAKMNTLAAKLAEEEAALKAELEAIHKEKIKASKKEEAPKKGKGKD